MYIKSAGTKKFITPFKAPFSTGQRTYIEREGVFLRLIDQSGQIGFGEASPLPGYSQETFSDVQESLEKLISHLMDRELPDKKEELERAAAIVSTELCLPPSAQFAFESAVYDIASKLAGKSLSRWLTTVSASSVALSSLCPLSISPGELENRSGTIKCKLTAAVGESLGMLERLLAIVPDGIRIRLDANQMYSRSDATLLLRELEHPAIEFIEEPVMAPTEDLLCELRSIAKAPIALDESLGVFVDIDQVIKQKLASVMILKPAYIGGISRTLKIAQCAKLDGIGIVITSMLETGVGLLGCLHCAAAVEAPRKPAGLDTLRLLADGLVTGEPVIDSGCMFVPDIPGIGGEVRDFTAGLA